MKNVFLFVAGALASLSLSAADIKDVIVRQQWPWSTAVRVEYVLDGVDKPVDISVDVFDGETKLESVALVASLSGDVSGVVASGAYVLEIDPVKAFGSSRSTISNFRVKLGVKESSPEMLDVVYKIFDLTGKEGTTDIRRADLLNGKYGTVETDYSKIIPGSSVGDCLVWTGVTNKPMYKTTHLVMRKIIAAGKSYTMGAKNELGQVYDGRNYTGYEYPHKVSFASDFYMAVFPTTKFQHKLILGQSPDESDETLRTPAQNILFTDLRGYFVSNGILGWWPDAGTWSSNGFMKNPNGSAHDVESSDGRVNALHKLRVKTGDFTFDLPTEARWEYCCRAGTVTATYAGDLTVEDFRVLDPVVNKIGWSAHNSGSEVKEVGLKAANPWGLYDMIGNVNELCLDVAKTDMTSVGSVEDPPGDSSDNRYVRRIARGCDAYATEIYRFRSAFRNKTTDPHADAPREIGYRLCAEDAQPAF